MAKDLYATDGTLAGLGEYIDERGRAFSAFIERGSDGIPAKVPGMPDAAGLQGLSTTDPADVATMNLTLERYGVVNTPDELIEAQSDMLQRFNIGPNDPRYKAEMERLATTGSGRVLLGQSRRVSQRVETLRGINGNTNQRCVYICEGEDPCEECEPLGGTDGPYKMFVQENMAPGDRCLGGSLCQCALVPVG